METKPHVRMVLQTGVRLLCPRLHFWPSWTVDEYIINLRHTPSARVEETWLIWI